MTALLVLTRTAGYRHESIPAALAALQRMPGMRVRASEDPDDILDAADRDAVVFLCTIGEVLHEQARVVLRAFVEGGGGFVGIHSAAATEPDWPWYGDLVGARFAGHPDGVQDADVEAGVPHPSTAGLPRPWRVADEWYAFTAMRDDLDVLLQVDESTYQPGRFTMAPTHPQAWCRAVGAGRSWYTGLGHTVDIWSDELFLAHVLGGIRWAARSASGD